MIAITGANGLLGSYIARRLHEEGKPFVALKRKDSDTSLLADHRTTVWRDADVTDPVSLREALDGVSTVIHAAAMVSFNPRLKKKLFATNVDGTRNVVDVCLTKNIPRLIHISSIAAIGRTAGDRLIDEENKWIDSSLNTLYAQSKYFAELEVFRGAEEGLSTVVLNPSVILAPADWNKSSAKLFKYAWEDRPFYIDRTFNYVDVRDVAEAVTKLLAKPSVNNERFIVNGGNVSLYDFLKAVATRFGKRGPRVKLSPWSLKVAAALEGARAAMLGGEPLITSETARLAATFFEYSNEKIKKTLDVKFQTIDDTLDWCCGYYLNFIAKK